MEKSESEQSRYSKFSSDRQPDFFHIDNHSISSQFNEDINWQTHQKDLNQWLLAPTSSRTTFHKRFKQMYTSWLIGSYLPSLSSNPRYSTSSGITHLIILFLGNNFMTYCKNQIPILQKACPNLKKLTILNDTNYYHFGDFLPKLSNISTLQEIIVEANLECFLDSFLENKTVKKVSINLRGNDRMLFEEENVKGLSSYEELSLVEVGLYQDSGKTMEVLGEMENLHSVNFCMSVPYEYVHEQNQLYFDELGENHYYHIEHAIPKQIWSKLLILSKTLQKIGFVFPDRNVDYILFKFENPTDFVQTINKLQNLQSLTIKNIFTKNLPADTLKLLKTNLKQIKFHNIFASFFHYFRQFKENNKQIEEIQLSKCQIRKQKFYGFKGLTLKSLEIKKNKYLSQKGISKLTLEQPKLLHLKLIDCTNINSSSVVLICKQLQELRSLHLNRCFVRNSGMIYIRKLKKLEKVCLDFNFMTSSVFTNLMLNLKKVSISQHKSVGSLIKDRENKHRLVENVNQATQVWMNFYHHEQLESYNE